MLIYACLSLYKSYKDRYKMFAAMCNHNVRVRMILLHGMHPPASEVPEGFEQFTIPSNTNFLTRRKYLRELLVAAPGSERTIVHDIGAAQMSMELRNRWTWKRNKSNLRTVLSLYSPTPGFIFGGRWLGSKEFRIKVREAPYYLRKHIPEILGELCSCNLADAIVGNTEEIAEDLQKYYGVSASRTHFVSAEINTDYFCIGQCERKELGLSQEEKIILYVGDLQRRKGIDVLFRSFDLLARKNPRIRLVILGQIGDAGYPWFKDLLRSLPNAKKIEMRGEVDTDTLRDYYRSCDVFAMPTYHEGSPRVVKEAMACGLPIVASRASGNLAIDQYGKSLVYASDRDPEEYADLMNKVLNDSEFRQKRIDAGLKLVQNLSLDAVAQKYLELYDSLY